jgi:cellulose synthase (UDP-forming)
MHEPGVRLLIAWYICVACAFLYWRTAYSFNGDAPIVAGPFLAADFLGFFSFLLFSFQGWARVRDRPAPAPPGGMSVDVYITTYNEDLHIIRTTVTAAVAMDYPHVTYVLDDGCRTTVRQLCEELGAIWLTRPDNRGAKAGNINAALPRTSGDFIAFLDADHAPFPNFLTALLGHFCDPGVALVQAPQAYYNLDSFQHYLNKRGRPLHEQSVFYDVLMPGKDRHNAAFWCGSSAIIRRSALVEVGGVDTRTVTEDMHTSMNMHARGWKSLYCNRELAVGIAPDDAQAFLVQRYRWARGAVQLFRADNPLFKRGLSLAQRFEYLASVAYVFEYIPKGIFLLTPPVALLSGQLPMRQMGWALLFGFVPYWTLGLVATKALTRGTTPLVLNERFYVLKMGIMWKAVAGLFLPGSVKFHVTPKSGSAEDSRFRSLQLLRTQIAIGALSVVALVWALFGLLMGAPWKLHGIDLAVTSVWTLLNAGLVTWLASVVTRRHHRRAVYRFATDVPGWSEQDSRTWTLRTTDLSALGVGWVGGPRRQLGDTLDIVLAPPGAARIRACVKVMAVRRDGDVAHYGGEFLVLEAGAQYALILFLYQLHAPGLFVSEVPASQSHEPATRGQRSVAA